MSASLVTLCSAQEILCLWRVGAFYIGWISWKGLFFASQWNIFCIHVWSSLERDRTGGGLSICSFSWSGWKEHQRAQVQPPSDFISISSWGEYKCLQLTCARGRNDPMDEFVQIHSQTQNSSCSTDTVDCSGTRNCSLRKAASLDLSSAVLSMGPINNNNTSLKKQLEQFR